MDKHKNGKEKVDRGPGGGERWIFFTPKIDPHTPRFVVFPNTAAPRMGLDIPLTMRNAYTYTSRCLFLRGTKTLCRLKRCGCASGATLSRKDCRTGKACRRFGSARLSRKRFVHPLARTDTIDDLRRCEEEQQGVQTFLYIRLAQRYRRIKDATKMGDENRWQKKNKPKAKFTGQDFLLFCCNYQSGSVDFLSFSGNGSHAN